MKRLLAFLPAMAVILLAMGVQAQTIPQRAKVSSSIGAAAAAVSCGPGAPSGSSLPLVNHLTGYTVMCGKASGSTSEASVTIAGLSGGATTLGYIDESTTQPTFLAEDLTYPVIAVDGATAITITMPAVTNGGPCTCVAFYVQY